jgi:hypothetical protein
VEGAADRHHFADRLHRGGEQRHRALNFSKVKRGIFGDDVIDRRLEAGGVQPVMSLPISSSV